MLVVTRARNQSIMIGDDIVVTVLEVRGDQVRIGIQAPRDVTIQREELLEREPRSVRSKLSSSSDQGDEEHGSSR